MRICRQQQFWTDDDVRSSTFSDEIGTLVAGRFDPRRRGLYGIDAPSWVAAFVALIVVNLANAIVAGGFGPYLPVLFLLACVGSYAYTTLRGKFVVWVALLDELEITGDERILDIGCGRGAVLLLAAQRLTTGQAVGVDLWRRSDQSGNSVEAARHNALAEGVADRVEFCTTDMSSLPFDDNSFDLVVSSLAIHNIKGRTGRDKAIDEAVRVLRPGGRLMIADIWTIRRCRERLVKIGLVDVVSRNLGWRFWWGGPWMPTSLVTATKVKSP